MFIDFRDRGGERERDRERQRERNINVRQKHRYVASHMHPDWELNLQPEYVP